MSGVAAFADVRIKFDLAQQRQSELFRRALAAAFAEDIDLVLAPAGWDIQSFKRDNIILDDPQSSDPHRALTVYVTRTFDPATIADGRSVTSTIDLGGRLATTAVHDLTRYLTFALSDGRGVTLPAPADLSANDLSRIARTVVVRRASTP